MCALLCVGWNATGNNGKERANKAKGNTHTEPMRR